MATGTTNVLNSSIAYSLTIETLEDTSIIITNLKGQIISEGTTQSGRYYVNGLAAGSYIINGFREDGHKINQMVSISEDTSINLYFDYIFGIQRKRAASANDKISSAWTRTDDAKNMVAVSGCYDIPGYSDFDHYYPWKGMAQEKINGNVMVKIPKFYYSRTVKDGIDSIKISMTYHPGFSIHPLFTANGYEAECAYVGAYLTAPGGMSSTASTGLKDEEFSKTEFRTKAKSLGDGWRQFDIYMMSALQMLVLVEYADNNVQKIIGKGNVSNSSGDALSMAASSSKIGYHTEIYQNDGKNSIVYRDITDIWGKLHIWVDGIVWKADRKYYICTNPANYATTSTSNTVTLNYLFPSGFTNIDNRGAPKATIIEVGYDSRYPFLMFPLYVLKGTDAINYGYTDSTGGWDSSNDGTTTIVDPIMFGCYDSGYGAGLFNFSPWMRGTKARWKVGGRLMYIPPKE